MRKIIHSSEFRRNTKKLLRQGKDMRKLVEIFDLLATDAELAPRFRDHALKGTWRGRRELHVESIGW